MNEPKSLDEIKIIARNENNRDIYIAIVHLCDYVKSLELLINNPDGDSARTSKKKGQKNG